MSSGIFCKSPIPSRGSDRGKVDASCGGCPHYRQMKPRYMTAWEANEMLRRLWEREWRLLTLVFGPSGDMWGTAGSRGGKNQSNLMKGISLTMKAGQVAVQFSPEAEEAAKKAYRMFFVRVLPVAPNKFRPPSVMGDQMWVQDFDRN